MEDTSYNLNFDKLCKNLSLGFIISEPQQVFGGLMHKMYRLKTDSGDYAVKALNPQIMQRKTAMNNFIFSDRVSRIAFESGINTVPAILSNGSSIHKIDSQFYLVFPWINGYTLGQNIVDIVKCRTIGKELAKIHAIDFSSIYGDNMNNVATSKTDWNKYFDGERELNQVKNSEFIKSLDVLSNIEERTNIAVKRLQDNLVISHRDLDPKNVLWNENNESIIIDWDAAGYINPSMELVEVALYWSGTDSGTPSKEALSEVVISYIENGGIINGDFEDILFSVFKSKLVWLEYNVKRSLGIECNSREEQKLGIQESENTMQSIVNHFKLIPILLKWLNKIKG